MESAKEADEWDFHIFAVANTADKPADSLQRLLPTFGSCSALFSPPPVDLQALHAKIN